MGSSPRKGRNFSHGKLPLILYKYFVKLSTISDNICKHFLYFPLNTIFVLSKSLYIYIYIIFRFAKFEDLLGFIYWKNILKDKKRKNINKFNAELIILL